MGNVVDPLSLIEVYGVDAFRYFVMREMAVGYDADFTPEQFHQRYQSDLGNEVGNLLNRTVSMIKRYRKQAIPKREDQHRTELDDDLEAKILQAIILYREHMDGFQVHTALGELWRGFQRANQYVEECAPWALAKAKEDAAQQGRLDYVLAQLVRAQMLLMSELAAVLPESAFNALSQLGQSGAVVTNIDKPIWPEFLSGDHVNDPEPLYPRIELEESEVK